MGFSLGNFFKGIVAQINPFDQGKTFGTYNPPQRPQPAPQPQAINAINNSTGFRVMPPQQVQAAPPPPMPVIPRLNLQQLTQAVNSATGFNPTPRPVTPQTVSPAPQGIKVSVGGPLVDVAKGLGTAGVNLAKNTLYTPFASSYQTLQNDKKINQVFDEAQGQLDQYYKQLEDAKQQGLSSQDYLKFSRQLNEVGNQLVNQRKQAVQDAGFNQSNIDRIKGMAGSVVGGIGHDLKNIFTNPLQYGKEQLGSGGANANTAKALGGLTFGILSNLTPGGAEEALSKATVTSIAKETSKTAIQDILTRVAPDLAKNGKLIADLAKTSAPKEVGVKIGNALSEARVAAENLPIAASKGSFPNAIQTSLGSAKTVLNRLGPAGQKLASILDQHVETAAKVEGGLRAAIIPATKGLSRQEFENFVATVRGEAKPINPKVATAVSAWQDATAHIPETLRAKGSKIGFQPNYFPNVYDFGKLGKNPQYYSKAIKFLVKSGQADSEAEAVRLLRQQSKYVAPRGASFERSRVVDLPAEFNQFRVINKGIIDRYLHDVGRRFADYSLLGKKGGKADYLLAQITKSHGDEGFKLAQQAYQNFVNPAPRATGIGGKSLSGLRKAFSFSKLGTAAISHIPQGIQNIGSIVGLGKTVKNLPKAFTKESVALAEKAGLLTPSELGAQRALEGFEGAIGKGTAPGLTPVMRRNRVLAAAVAKDYAEALLKKGDEAGLRKLGIEGKIGKQLTEEQYVQAARNLGTRTMFRSTALDLPLGASSQAGRTVGQFRLGYQYKQAGFVYDEILKEAGKRNILPFLRYLATKPTLDLAALGVKSAPRKALAKVLGQQDSEQYQNQQNTDQIIRALSGVGGVATEPLGSIPYLGGNHTISTLVGQVAPLLGDTVRLGENMAAAPKGKKLEALGRAALTDVPVVGSTIANAVFPYGGKSTPKTGNSSLDKAVQNAQKNPVTKDDYLTKGDQALAKNFTALKDAGQLDQYLADNPNMRSEYERVSKLAATAQRLADGNPLSSKLKEAVGKGLDTNTAKYLRDYENLSTQGKERFSNDPKKVFALKQAEYKRDKSLGILDTKEDYTRRYDLGKMSITSNFSKPVNELYSLSLAKMAQFLRQNPSQKDLLNSAIELDRKLLDKGYIASSKFFDKYGRSKLAVGEGGNTTVAKYGRVKKPTKAHVPTVKLTRFRNPTIKLSKAKTPKFSTPKYRRASSKIKLKIV